MGINIIINPRDMDAYATKESLNDYATVESLDDYATVDSLNGYATKTSLDSYATKNELLGYATKNELNDYAPMKALYAINSIIYVNKPNQEIGECNGGAFYVTAYRYSEANPYKYAQTNESVFGETKNYYIVTYKQYTGNSVDSNNASVIESRVGTIVDTDTHIQSLDGIDRNAINYIFSMLSKDVYLYCLQNETLANSEYMNYQNESIVYPSGKLLKMFTAQPNDTDNVIGRFKVPELIPSKLASSYGNTVKISRFTKPTNVTSDWNEKWVNYSYIMSCMDDTTTTLVCNGESVEINKLQPITTIPVKSISLSTEISKHPNTLVKIGDVFNGCVSASTMNPRIGDDVEITIIPNKSSTASSITCVNCAIANVDWTCTTTDNIRIYNVEQVLESNKNNFIVDIIGDNPTVTVGFKSFDIDVQKLESDTSEILYSKETFQIFAKNALGSTTPVILSPTSTVPTSRMVTESGARTAVLGSDTTLSTAVSNAGFATMNSVRNTTHDVVSLMTAMSNAGTNFETLQTINLTISNVIVTVEEMIIGGGTQRRTYNNGGQLHIYKTCNITRTGTSIDSITVSDEITPTNNVFVLTPGVKYYAKITHGTHQSTVPTNVTFDDLGVMGIPVVSSGISNTVTVTNVTSFIAPIADTITIARATAPEKVLPIEPIL